MPLPRPRRSFLLLLIACGAGGIVPLHAAEPPTEGLAATPSSVNGEATLTLGDFEQFALEGNPTLRLAAATLEAARGRAIQSGLYPNPTVGYAGEEMGSDGTAGEQGVFVSQIIVTGGKLRLSRAAFQQEAVQGEWQALAQQYRVLNGVRIQFYRLLAIQRLLEVQESLVQIAEETLRTTEELFNIGQANRPDVLQASIQVRQQGVALVTARKRYQAAWQELTALVGRPHLALTKLEGSLEPTGNVIDWNTALVNLLEASPQIQIARAGIARNRFALRREQVEPIPNVEMQVGTQYNFETESQQASVQAGLRLPVFNKNQGNIRAARADLVRSRAELQRIELSLQERLADVFAEYESGLNMVEEYREYILPESQEAFELYLESFRQRRAPWQQVVLSQQNYFQANVEYVEALNDVQRAEVAILGLLLVDGLDEPPGPPGEGGGGMDADRLQERLQEPLGMQGRGPNEASGAGGL